MEKTKKIDETIINEIAKKNNKYTKEELMIIASIRKIKNPFRMINIK